MKCTTGIINIFYNQFYICDDVLKPLAPENWTNEAIDRGVLFGDNIIAIKCEDGQYEIELNINDNSNKEYTGYNTFKLRIPNKIIGIYQWPFDKILSQKLKSDNCMIMYKFENNRIELLIKEIFA